MNTRGFSLRLYHQQNVALDSRALMQRVRALNASAISIIPTEYMTLTPGTPYIGLPLAEWNFRDLIFPDVGQDPQHPYANTMSLDAVEWVCAEAEAQGLEIMYKPHLDVIQEGAWRGNAAIPSATRLRQFKAAYKRFLKRHLPIVKKLRDPILCFGCEFVQITRDWHADAWIEIAEWIRSRYGGNYQGRLTYASNYGLANVDAEYRLLMPLWKSGLVNYVGIDMYPRFLTTPYEPSVNELLAAWDDHAEGYAWAASPAADVLAVAEQAGLDLVFTEFGIGNFKGAQWEPYADPPRENALRDDHLQTEYWRAFRQRFNNETRVRGFFAWDEVLGTVPDLGHMLNGREAEQYAFAL